MSGSNPFRRKGPGADPIGSSSGRANEDEQSTSKDTNVGGISAGQDDDARTQARPQKTVRIASPPVPDPVSPPPLERRSSADQDTTFKGEHIRRRGSPPPPLARNPGSDEVNNDDAADPFDSEESESDNEEEGSPNTGDSEGRNSASIGSGEHSGLSGEASDGGLRDGVQASYRGSLSGDDGATNQAPSADTQLSRRTTLDVDAFKRLLLTGDSGQETGQASTMEASGTAGEKQSKAHREPASKRDTTTSETHHDRHTYPPSHESIPSRADEERKGALARTGSVEKEKTKPPPPKTRHGKLIQSGDEATPAVLDSTSSSLAPSDLPSSRSTSTSTSSPSVHAEPQPDKQTLHPPSEASTISANTLTPDQAQLSLTPTPKAKRPPTPPLTRRHSQMKRAETGVSRSNSARQPHSTTGPSNTSNLSRAASTSKNPPPPPSPRRLQGDSAASQSSPIPSAQRGSSPNQGTSEEAPVPVSVEQQQQQHQDDSEKSSLQRSDSGSIKGSPGMTSSRKTSGSNIPPRPPPRRRTAQPTSSSSSSNPNYTEDPRPESNPTSETSAPTSTGTRDPTDAESTQNVRSAAGVGVLADLTQLQKEVDDLRGQHEERRPS